MAARNLSTLSQKEISDFIASFDVVLTDCDGMFDRQCYPNQPFKMAARNLSTLSQKEISDFIASFDVVLTDCDGVLWIEKNEVPGSADTVNKLKELGKKVFYVTNNSTKSRVEYVEKCKALGFPATEDAIISTSYLVAMYLKEIQFNKKVYIVGSHGLVEEMDQVGVKHLEIGPDPVVKDFAAIFANPPELDPAVGAVVVGFDEHFSYMKMLKAASYLKHPDCLFIATNTDEQFPVNSEFIVPGTGSILASIQAAAEREPFIVGKPHTYLREFILKKYQIDPKRTLMIGDRANTDILLGTRCGFQTLLVLTGVTSLEDVTRWQNSGDEKKKGLVPDFYLSKLGDLLPHI